MACSRRKVLAACILPEALSSLQGARLHCRDEHVAGDGVLGVGHLFRNSGNVFTLFRNARAETCAIAPCYRAGVSIVEFMIWKGVALCALIFIVNVAFAFFTGRSIEQARRDRRQGR